MPWRPSALQVSGWGQRQALPLEVTRRILSERAEGRTFQAIADGLVADGIPTARGRPAGIQPRSRRW